MSENLLATVKSESNFFVSDVEHRGLRTKHKRRLASIFGNRTIESFRVRNLSSIEIDLDIILGNLISQILWKK